MRRSVLLSIAAAATVLAGLVYRSWQHSTPPRSTPVQVQADGPVVEPSPQASATPPAPPAPVFDSTDVVIQRNDTLDGIFRHLKLSLTDLSTIRNLPGVRQALDFLRPGDSLTLTHHEGELKGLVRQINDTQTLSVTRDAAGFAAQIIENPLDMQVTRKHGRITSSLFEAASSAGISDQTAMALADIFGWDIDFVLDIREGDEFTVVFNGLWRDGEYLRDGEILAAEFINDGQVFRAVRYKLPNGQVEYFNPEGRSMHKTFLRAPLEFTRVSSRFNPNRRHPVLNTIRAHKGVDYAAPTGTPVRAAGEGRVQMRGRYGGYGNAIVLEHGNGITTLYGHLSRFAKGIQQGGRVRQGQVIAYVGQTGLASGPHLHYEYRINGVHKNPQTVKLPGAKPIAPELLADFRTQTQPLLTRLDPVAGDPMVAHQ